MSKIPADAFEQYVALGPQRSYRTLADQLHVSKRAVSKCAQREDWAGRLAKIDLASRQRSDEWLAETLDEMRHRHLRSLKAVQGRALEALKNYPLNSAAEAVSALEKAIRLERLVMGEAGERSELAVSEITKRELDTLLVDEADAGDDEQDDDGDEPEGDAAQAG